MSETEKTQTTLDQYKFPIVRFTPKPISPPKVYQQTTIGAWFKSSSSSPAHAVPESDSELKEVGTVEKGGKIFPIFMFAERK
jgi:hypothetical protein